MLYSPTINRTYLPSATKLRRLYFHRRLSVHRGVSAPGGVCSWGVPGPGGCLVQRGAWSRGVPGPGGVPGAGGCLVWGVEGLVSQHALRQTPPGEMATAADGTHPTGMHSCTQIISSLYR